MRKLGKINRVNKKRTKRKKRTSRTKRTRRTKRIKRIKRTKKYIKKSKKSRKLKGGSDDGMSSVDDGLPLPPDPLQGENDDLRALVARLQGEISELHDVSVESHEFGGGGAVAPPSLESPEFGGAVAPPPPDPGLISLSGSFLTHMVDETIQHFANVIGVNTTTALLGKMVLFARRFGMGPFSDGSPQGDRFDVIKKYFIRSTYDIRDVTTTELKATIKFIPITITPFTVVMKIPDHDGPYYEILNNSGLGRHLSSLYLSPTIRFNPHEFLLPFQSRFPPGISFVDQFKEFFFCYNSDGEEIYFGSFSGEPGPQSVEFVLLGREEPEA